MQALDALEEISRTDPGRTALISGETKFTYQQLKNLILDYSQFFTEAKLLPGERIGIHEDQSFETVALVYAAIFSGLTYVPLPLDDSPARLRQMIARAELKAIFSGAKEKLPQIDVTVYPLAVPSQDHGSKSLRRPATGGQQIIYMLFTSGSTGIPKGVLISAACVQNFVDWASQALGISKLDIFLAHTNLTFDLSVFNLFVPLANGAALRLIPNPMDRLYPGKVLEQGVTVALLVPRVTMLMNEAKQITNGNFKNLRHLLFCGEKLMAAQVRPWVENSPGLKIHNLYGPTEATVACSAYTLEGPPRDPIPIGRPLPHIQFHLPESGEGELIISGVQVSPADYWKESSGKFLDDPSHGRCYLSGDWVSRDPEGQYFWHYRTDEQIKSKGFRVELGEIESVLLNSPLVKDAVCVYRSQIESIEAFVTVHEHAETNILESLRSHCQALLPLHMRPRTFSVIKEIPRTENGKADRKKL